MKPGPEIALIAAMDRRHAIGRGGELLWHEREDQKHFRAVTMGFPVIMGRKTWDSLPPKFKPLPGRRNIVVTRNRAWQAGGAEAAPSLAAALALVADSGKAYVIGGGELYALALPLADELVMTEVDADFEAPDTYFPEFDRSLFAETARRSLHTEAGVGFAFVTYRRRTRSCREPRGPIGSPR